MKSAMNLASRAIVCPEDSTPFFVGMDQTVRLKAEGIAGSTAVVQVNGPATVTAENSLSSVRNGRTMLGMSIVEFDLVPTGSGSVTVTIISTPPMRSATPSVMTYSFEVR